MATEVNPWQPLSTLPRSGKFCLASYAPTNWSYYVSTVVFYEEDLPRLREMRLKYVRAWMHAPPEPPQDINDR